MILNANIVDNSIMAKTMSILPEGKRLHFLKITIKEATALMEFLRDPVASDGNLVDPGFLAHSVANRSANLGLVLLQTACLAYENAIQGDHVAMAGIQEELETAIVRTLPILRDYILLNTA